MKVFKIDDMKGGWFVGNFEPTVYKTEGFEVGFHVHEKGEEWPAHYHKVGTEITYLMKGKMIIQGKTLVTGDVFVIHPYEIADPIFLEQCTVVIVKTPSDTMDKYVI